MLTLQRMRSAGLVVCSVCTTNGAQQIRASHVVVVGIGVLVMAAEALAAVA